MRLAHRLQRPGLRAVAGTGRYGGAAGAHPPPRARVPALAAEIVDYLASEVAALDLFKWAILRCSTDLPELHSLCVLRVPDPSYGVWGAGGGGGVRHATEADIRRS